MPDIQGFNHPERHYLSSRLHLTGSTEASTATQLKVLRDRVTESIRRGLRQAICIDHLFAIATHLVGDLFLLQYPASIWEGRATAGGRDDPVLRLGYVKTHRRPGLLTETPRSDFCLTLEITHITTQQKEQEQQEADDHAVGSVDKVQVLPPDDCIFSGYAIAGLVKKMIILRDNHRQGAEFCEHSDRWVLYLPVSPQGYIQVTLRTIAEIGIFEPLQQR